MKQVWLGIGCDRGCSLTVIEQAALVALSGIGLAADNVCGIASIDAKAREPALSALSLNWNIPLQFYPATRLEQETPRLLNPSDKIFAMMGCHGVAEAAALAGAGPDSFLLVPKVKGSGVTIAVAGPK